MEKHEIGGACSTNGEEKCVQGFGGGNLRKKNHLEYPGLDGAIILKWIFRKWVGGSMDWIDLVQDRDGWRKLVNSVMKPLVSTK
jgi:hypothetical protein